ncbi:MAG: DUF2207 domain-containing protein [Oscillospiraceae bacterium]|nr:DUF2207 domain-containing protein [Oscillospiraceae bacterium]
MIKKTCCTLLCALLFLLSMGQAAFAANNVSDIAVDVVINDDGSAKITQTWNCNFDEGTEGYIPIENLGEMTISDFSVSDENGAFTYIDNWDISASFDEKVGKCGIVETDRGYELCWGIGQYGERHYTIAYKMNGLVGSYTDVDGFNFQFINTGMGTLPTNVTVKISMQNGTLLDTSNSGIWAFGFEGQIEFQNGQVVAYTEKALSTDTESVIVMLQLNKGLISPTRAVSDSFETVKNRAFEGSDYSSDSEKSSEGIGFFTWLLIFAVSAFVVLAVITAAKRNKKIKALYKNAQYFREAPLGGNIEETFVLAAKYNQASDEGDLIGAAFLKLINVGCLEPITEKSVGFFGKEKESVSLRLVRRPELSGLTADRLYSLLELACGSDRILQEKELEKYCKKNHDSIQEIIDAAKEHGEMMLNKMACYDSSKAAKPLGLSQLGTTLLSNIMGFKKYLLEFSLIAERTIAESVIWQDYLVFATLLGIAEKAIEQFEKVYPVPTQYSENAHYYYFLAYSFRHASYDTAQAARSSGGGGSSSFGGGGGFSGGGGGGGAR